MHLTFVIGGARSGKSLFAQQLAQQRGEERAVFVATLRETDDPEMQQRIARHRVARPARWPTIVLDAAWRDQIHALPICDIALLDCLSLFISGQLFMTEDAPTRAASACDVASIEDHAEALTNDLLAAMHTRSIDWIVVSNEVGMATVPEHPQARAYRDALGRANQVIMRAASEAYLLIAGAPMKVK
jgi:adenosylcobinamide kinase/adenosylcobinamide-phosphate guanylyltransferase